MRVERIVARVSGHGVLAHRVSPERHRGCGVHHRAASGRVLEAADDGCRTSADAFGPSASTEMLAKAGAAPTDTGVTWRTRRLTDWISDIARSASPTVTST